MDSEGFVAELEVLVEGFCRRYDVSPPAYSYVPCVTDEQRVRVMKSRLHNELRAASLYGTWLSTTPEFEVKAIMAQSAKEETDHARLLVGRIENLGYEPFDYNPLPAQTAMFNALAGLDGTCARIAGFPLAGETVASFLIAKSLASDSVPEWIKTPYRVIHAEEEQHGSVPRGILLRYAVTEELQDAARRAVVMRLGLFKEYLASLDRWVLQEMPW